jgi:hypothetical protein
MDNVLSSEQTQVDGAVGSEVGGSQNVATIDGKDGTLYWASVRYALGRMTYVVSDVCELVIRDWPRLSPRIHEVIIRDIQEAMAAGNTGMECDRQQWLRVLALAAISAPSSETKPSEQKAVAASSHQSENVEERR